jgi:hypothetical protein
MNVPASVSFLQTNLGYLFCAVHDVGNTRRVENSSVACQCLGLHGKQELWNHLAARFSSSGQALLRSQRSQRLELVLFCKGCEELTELSLLLPDHLAESAKLGGS